MDIHQLTATSLWLNLALSVYLALWGLASRNWVSLLVSVVPSALFSWAAGFSIGWITLLLPCLQFAGALGVGLKVSLRGWAALVLAAILGWWVLYWLIW